MPQAAMPDRLGHGTNRPPPRCGRGSARALLLIQGPSHPTAGRPLDYHRLIAARALGIDASGIRRVFDLASQLEDPVNLSIGQPDFEVPEPIRRAAVDAINAGRNSYTVTQGIEELRRRIAAQVAGEFPRWQPASGEGTADGYQCLVTSGVSGALLLAILACAGPGDEVIMPDPAFVMYRHLVTLAGATAVHVDTYPDFQLTASRIEPYLSERTRLVLFNSPSNPTGVVAGAGHCRELAELCDRCGVLLVSDEIYDAFCFDGEADPGGGEAGVPGADETAGGFVSPARYSENVLVLRGFSKTYAMTGWRLGYAVGPAPIVSEMTKLQQYTFVCAPSMVQVAGVTAMKVDMSEHIAAYRRKRDRVVEALGGMYELTRPGGAFYAFVKVPEPLGLTATAFVEKAITEHGLLIIPGHVFSLRDTHFRLSYACPDATLERGLGILEHLARG